MLEGVHFYQFPIPPSDNALYSNVPRIGRVKTSAYRTWKKEVDAWAWLHLDVLQEARRLTATKPLLSIHLLLKMPENSFWTQKGAVKRMDASNRLKASLDAIAELIHLDDSHFWHVSIQKCAVAQEKEALDIQIKIHSMWDSGSHGL